MWDGQRLDSSRDGSLPYQGSAPRRQPPLGVGGVNSY